jgi:hypothetical protein
MSYNRNHARRLLNASELQLFEASLKENIASLSRAEVAKKVDRTRKLRDKYADLFRRQSLATRDRTGTKRGTSGAANERTSQKATIFAEVLTRFETQLDKLDRAEARASKKAALERARAAKGGGGRTTPKGGGPRTTSSAAPAKARAKGPKQFMDEGANQARQAAQMSSPRNKKINASVGARGRRSQAKRDAR